MRTGLPHTQSHVWTRNGGSAQHLGITGKTDMKTLRYGIEIETVGQTRLQVAKAIQSVVGGTVTHVGTPVIIADSHSGPVDVLHPGLLLPADAESEAVAETMDALDRGRVRVAEPEGGEWRVNGWVKEAVLLYFGHRRTEVVEHGPFEYRDKIPLKKDLDTGDGGDRAGITPGVGP